MKKTILIFIIISSLIFVACKKDNSLPVRFTPNPEGNTNVKFLNMSPGAASINFFANGNKISGTTPTGATATVVTGMGFPSIYPNTVGYATLPSGSQKIDVKVPDSAAAMPGTTVLTATQNFLPKKFYTFVLLDTVTQAKMLLVEDDPTVSDPSKAYMRVANFTADSAINVVVTKTSAGYTYSKTYLNVSPKSALTFDSLGAGQGQVYSVSFRRASNDLQLGIISSFAPSPTKKYTFYMRGLVRTTSTTGVGIYTNF